MTIQEQTQVITLADYLAHYAADHYEWVEGSIIKLSPVHLKHDTVVAYLRILLQAYFEIKPIGQVVSQPFVLRLPEFPNRRREPDLQVILNNNPNELKDTYMDGAPDICIEVVSPESTARDYGDKFSEYETGKIPEYWIIDPIREETHFYQLNTSNRYQSQQISEAGHYISPKLPQLSLPVNVLWQHKLPGPGAIVKQVQDMLKS